MCNETEMGIAEMHISIIVPAKNLERCTLFSQAHTMLLFFHHLPTNIYRAVKMSLVAQDTW